MTKFVINYDVKELHGCQCNLSHHALYHVYYLSSDHYIREDVRKLSRHLQPTPSPGKQTLNQSVSQPAKP